MGVSVNIKPVQDDELPDLDKGSGVHCDIEASDLPGETERALGLGASLKRGPIGTLEQGQYTVFADVDGNAFCLYTVPQV